MSTTQTYTATATRESRRGWVVDVPDVGMTQARSLADAEVMAIDLIAVVREVPHDQVRVTVTPVLPDATRAALDTAREADKAWERAHEQRREVIRKLRASGMSIYDTARIAGVTVGRVSQIAAIRRTGPRKHKERTPA